MVCGKWIYMRLLFQERPSLSCLPVCLESAVANVQWACARAHISLVCLTEPEKMPLFFFLCVIFYYVTRNNWNKSSHQTNSILYHYVEGAGRIKWKQAGAFCLFSLRFPSFSCPLAETSTQHFYFTPFSSLSVRRLNIIFAWDHILFAKWGETSFHSERHVCIETTAGRVCLVVVVIMTLSLWAPRKKSFYFLAFTCFSRFWHT